MSDLDALVARLREAADTLLALRQEMADEDAGSALALRQRDTARGDFERAELARATASAERDAALRTIADTRRMVERVIALYPEAYAAAVKAKSSAGWGDGHGAMTMARNVLTSFLLLAALDACPEPAGEEGQDG